MAINVSDVIVRSASGEEQRLGDWNGTVLLIVNVASRCGFTRQYAGLQKLQDSYGPRGFAVLGFPCNDFGSQEPGSLSEIQQFCSSTYGVTFPLTEKVEVNGDGRHPLYDELVDVADDEGHTGDIRWNFEKFLVGKEGTVLARFKSGVEPESAELTSAIEAALAA